MLTLHRLGFLLTDGSPDVVQIAYGEFIQSQVDELASVVDKTMDAVRTVTSDTGLKKAGVTERLRGIGDTAVDRVRKSDEFFLESLVLDRGAQRSPTHTVNIQAIVV